MRVHPLKDATSNNNFKPSWARHSSQPKVYPNPVDQAATQHPKFSGLPGSTALVSSINHILRKVQQQKENVVDPKLQNELKSIISESRNKCSQVLSSGDSAYRKKNNNTVSYKENRTNKRQQPQQSNNNRGANFCNISTPVICSNISSVHPDCMRWFKNLPSIKSRTFRNQKFIKEATIELSLSLQPDMKPEHVIPQQHNIKFHYDSIRPQNPPFYYYYPVQKRKNRLKENKILPHSSSFTSSNNSRTPQYCAAGPVSSKEEPRSINSSPQGTTTTSNKDYSFAGCSTSRLKFASTAYFRMMKKHLASSQLRQRSFRRSHNVYTTNKEEEVPFTVPLKPSFQIKPEMTDQTKQFGESQILLSDYFQNELKMTDEKVVVGGEGIQSEKAYEANTRAP